MAALDLGKYKKFVQYFYDPEPTNVSPSSIWCLGKEYRALDKPSGAKDMHFSAPNVKSSPIGSNRAQPSTPPDSTASSIDSNLAYEETEGDNDGGWPSSFLDDFEARIWLTYRSNFPAIPKSQDPKAQAAMSLPVRIRSQFDKPAGFTSDTGWGCMIRSGQSLLANALVMVRMGRGQNIIRVLVDSPLTSMADWRRGSSGAEERKIISLFADTPNAPYSIHKFVEHGATACGKHPGEWFGPSATARCIQ